ncbi:MAG: (d)CMP kinase [Clostridiales bacterium]|nr:(d)CMP kinase [Clostridia bacterium]MCR4884604.1 (d)CMP kinase [Clostridiales bacterium]
MPINIAMDGPVGAGKSTIADCVANALGILHLDTGAMYRAVGVTALKRGIDPCDEEKVTEMCRSLVLDVSYAKDGQHTYADGEDVTGILRTEEASMAASKVATYPGVRAQMVEAQQRMAKNHDMLVDGRDIGTRVLADAPVKIYLTASPEVRARRRYLQLQEKGTSDTYEKVLADLIERDRQDMNRKTDPLRKAEDAVEVDTSELTFDESVQEILRIVKEALGVG